MLKTWSKVNRNFSTDSFETKKWNLTRYGNRNHGENDPAVLFDKLTAKPSNYSRTAYTSENDLAEIASQLQNAGMKLENGKVARPNHLPAQAPNNERWR